MTVSFLRSPLCWKWLCWEYILSLGRLPMQLDESAVRQLLRMEDVIPAMEQALAIFSSGNVVQPVRTLVPVAEHQGFLG